jgi:hypothetical protein
MKKQKSDKEKVIIPKKDFKIFFPPLYDIQLIKGEEKPVPVMFLENLKTEKVI